MFIKDLYDLCSSDSVQQYSSSLLMSDISSTCNSQHKYRALDLGCGDGKSYDWFGKNFKSFEWIGIDIESSPEVNSRSRDDCTFYVFDGINIPFEENHFDFIFSNQVFEHVRYPELLLAEVHRVLKPGGVFFGSVSYLEPFHSYSIFNFTPYGFYRICKESNITPVFMAGGIDGISLIQRSFDRGQAKDEWWDLSPLNKSIIDDSSLTIKEKNYRILMNTGHIVFKCINN